MMGWTPRQVDETPLWDFLAAWEGWRAFNAAPQGPKPPTDEEFRAAVAADLSATIH